MHWLCCDTAEFSEKDTLRAYEGLSPTRKARVDRLRLQEDKTRSLVAELLVQKLLAEHFGIHNAVLHQAPNGQPYLSGCELCVSISHSDRMVACAVSRELVGIDIERIRPIDLKLCRHVCVEEEKAYVLQGCPLPENTLCRDAEILHRFFEIWTAKEAYFKKLGTGITDLKSVNALTLAREKHLQGEYMLHIV